MMYVPLGEYFPEYTGGADVDKAIQFIRTRFTDVYRAGVKVQTQCVPVFWPTDGKIF